MSMQRLKHLGRTLQAPLSPTELNVMRLKRQQRVLDKMAEHQVDAILITDPVNIRYATDARNMSLFHMRNPVRYFLCILNGPRILFESAFGDAEHTEDLPTIDATVDPIGFTYTSSGDRNLEHFQKWYKQMEGYLAKHNCKHIAIEGKISNLVKDRFEADGHFVVKDAVEIMEKAKCIKNEEEVKCIKYAIDVVADAYTYMHKKCKPGMTENKLWSHFHQHVIEHDSEYIETRLMTSGEKTNPWFQECGTRKISKDEMIAIDTDTIGCFGYYVDFSRSFVCPDRNGNVNVSEEQKRLCRLAYDQVQYNMSLIRPGLSFKEYCMSGWEIPQEYVQNRYHVLAHGIGMTGEYPYIFHKYDWDQVGYDGVLKEGMTLCVESFIGHESNTGEGVKYEEQVLITKDGYENLTGHIPIEPYFLE